MYEEMEDTSWITGLRQIGDAGNQGILDNYSKVNVFDDTTRADLEGRVNAIYNRTLNDFDRDYTNTMNKTLARDYGRFGTTNATPALYNRDTYNLQQQRKLADLQYQKAATYDTFLNNELQRRYNTLNMFKGLSDMGAVPYQQDLANWKIRNENKDRKWMNDVDARNSKQAAIGNVIEFIPTVIGAVAGTIAGGNTLAGAALGNAIGGAASGLATGGMQSYGSAYSGGDDSSDALLSGLGSWYVGKQLDQGKIGFGNNAISSAINSYVNGGNTSYGNSMNGLANYINSYIAGGANNTNSNSAIQNALSQYFGTLGAGNNVI